MNGFFDPLPFGPGVYAPRATPQWNTSICNSTPGARPYHHRTVPVFTKPLNASSQETGEAGPAAFEARDCSTNRFSR